MSGEENPKPVYIDPQCIQEALRTYFLPIKNDDPQLAFYTMYKRETVEYDTEYMQKYSEDLNTALIFAGLFSAVSSAFVIDVQSKLQPDFTDAYLRAILLNFNRSIAPDEVPTGPPAWNGPPAEIITTSDLLYASLLVSLLAAFVAMLGKQWLNRSLRHTGGSMIERCGDRQRKFDDLERWPFRLFIESLHIMLQIALLLLACGLSRYMWSVNIHVACVILSFTVFGVLFYTGIAIAGIWSYECPFRTPALRALRYLVDSAIAWKLFVSPYPPKVISVAYTTWMSTRQMLVSAPRRVYNATQNQLTREISLVRIMSGIRGGATNAGHKTIILLLQVDRAFGNAKQRLVKRIRRLRRAGLLPSTVEDAHHQPPVPRGRLGLRVRVRNLDKIRKQNVDNGRCVSWFLRNITDPEAIECATRLAGTIRWFDDDPDLDPPFDLIVSTFEACFDSTGQLYPGMRDQAYFSGRAILRIKASAMAQSDDRACKYPIPAVASSSFQHTDPDLHHVLYMLELNSGLGRPATLDFPRVGTNTHAHLLWMSNLFVDFTSAGPKPILKSYRPYLGAAAANHRPTIANTLLVWYMFLGGYLEEETFWAVDKSDSLEIILSCLSARVMDVIANGYPLHHLSHLLEFLAAWEKRPGCLTAMTYEWCSAISEAVGRLEQEETTIIRSPSLRDGFQHELRLRLQQRSLAEGPEILPPTIEAEFREVGSGCGLDRLDNPTRRDPLHDPTPSTYAHLLSITLEIGFRMAAPDQPAPRLNHTFHHEWIFKTAFSSRDDEVIADAVCAWIGDGDRTPPGSCARYLYKRVERDTPFSPRLRWASICAIERIWRSELKMSVLGTIHLLDRLSVDVDDVVKEREWVELLVDVIYSPTGPGSLSSHYWRLLDKLVLLGMVVNLGPRGAGVAKSLEEAEDWEKLETWMAIAWRSLLGEPMEAVGRTTLKLLSRRPSALPRFENICGTGIRWVGQKVELRRICDEARTELLPSESPPNQLTRAQPTITHSFLGDDTF